MKSMLAMKSEEPFVTLKIDPADISVGNPRDYYHFDQRCRWEPDRGCNYDG